MQPLQKYGGTLSSDFLEKQRSQGIDDRDTATQMAQSSDTFRNHFTQIQEATKGDPQAVTAYLNMRFYGDAEYRPDTPEPKGYIGRTLDRMYKDFVTDTNESLGRRERGEQGAIQTAAEIAPNIASGILSPVTEGVSTVANKALEFTGLDSALQSVAKSVMDSGFGEDVVIPAIQRYQEEREKNPALRSLENVAELGVDVADVLGLGAVAKSGVVGATKNAIRHPIQTTKQAIKKDADNVVAQTAEEVLSPAAENAIKRGMDEKVVRFVEERSPTEKVLMKDIYNAAKEGADKLGGTNKHKQIAGEQIMRNAEYTIEQRKNVGKALGNIKTAMADETVDLTEVSFRVLHEMRSRGVVINERGKVVSISSGADSEIPTLQKIVDGLLPDKDGRVVRTFKEADDYRSKVFDEINAAKANLSPTSQGQSALSKSDNLGEFARSAVMKEMGTLNPNYQKLSQAYAELVNEPADFFKLLGYKGDLEKIGSESLRAGEVYLRVLGNASSRPEAALKKLTALSRKYGFETDVDEMALLQFADAVEDIFPSAPTRSLRGEAGRAGKDAAEELVKNKSLVKTALSFGDEKLMNFVRRLRKMTPEDRDAAFLELFDNLQQIDQ